MRVDVADVFFWRQLQELGRESLVLVVVDNGPRAALACQKSVPLRRLLESIVDHDRGLPGFSDNIVPCLF